MPKYHVELREVWVQTYEVDADCPESAMEYALAGYGNALDGMLEYSHTPDLQNDVESSVTEVREIENND